MTNLAAAAVACPNIAFIKYWGNRDQSLRLPVNGSISMNLGGLQTTTRLTFVDSPHGDSLTLNGRVIQGDALVRVTHFLDHARAMAGINLAAQVISENNFPIGAGIASSAAAFAALAVAADAALDLRLTERQISRLARLGSGSACRSVPAGYVEWFVGEDDQDSVAETIAPSNHWQLIDLIAVVEQGHKLVGSSQGHALADSSPLQMARVQDTPRRLDICRRAILTCDFDALAQMIELDSNIMHAVMMTSQPSLMYWTPASLAVMQAARSWRAAGIPAAFTLDAGPNVHVLTEAPYAEALRKRLQEVPGVREVLSAFPGEAAHPIE